MGCKGKSNLQWVSHKFGDSVEEILVCVVYLWEAWRKGQKVGKGRIQVGWDELA